MKKKYNIIYADPPWTYNDKALAGERGACCKYDVMTVEDIKNLPIKKISGDNCILFIWVTMPLIQEGLDIIKAWGFKYKTCGFSWVKKTKTGKNHFGLGHYTRGNVELCFIGTKGKFKRQVANISQLIEAEIQRHSQKPEIIRDKIVELCGDIPRVELFARQETLGWESV